MKDLLDKLSSYNIFNHLFPGIVFVAIIEKATEYSFLQDNIVIGVFVYYFIGLVISRFGSLVLEPILKFTKFVRFADYSDFLAASKEGPKMELLSEVSNMYRTISSLLISIVFLKLYECMKMVEGSTN